MTARFLAVIALPATLSLALAPSSAQTTTAATQPTAGIPQRAVRRDIPMTRMIQRAFAAGTRDSTGRPGRNYWQLWNDYKINASLDPATSIVTGRETVTIHNNSDSAMRTLVLRLDQNLFGPNVARASPAIEITDGMQITRNPDGTDNYTPEGNQIYAKNLKGKLLLAHGKIDNNVPPYNTLLVVNELIKANKDFDLILLPNRTHGFGNEPYMVRRRWDYFVRNLLGAEPPKEYEIKSGVRPRVP